MKGTQQMAWILPLEILNDEVRCLENETLRQHLETLLAARLSVA